AGAAGAARVAAATELARTILSTAAGRQAEAEAAMGREAFVDAARLFAEASAAFDQAADAAVAEVARRRAEEERRPIAEGRARQLAEDEEGRAPAAEAAGRARGRAAAAAELARPILSTATGRQAEAEAAMGREAFVDAARLFAEASAAFDQAADAAVAEAARRRAEEAARQRAAAEAEARRKAEEEA